MVDRTAVRSVRDPASSTGEEAPSDTGGDLALELRNTAATIGDRTLWRGVDLRLWPGQFLAVLGPNGAGKSTLLRILLGQLPPAAGQVRVLGATPGQANREIGYLPQRRSFDASTRVRGRDIVRLGLDGHRWGVPVPGASRISSRARAASSRVDEVINRVGASEYADRPIGELSGGEQQRLLIAQCLVRRPRLLLLDEPLDSLDLPNQAATAALVASICRSDQVAVVIVAHDVNPIVAYLDQVLYLAPTGAACGTVDQVVTTATLSRLYQTPVEVLSASDGRLVVVGVPDAPAMHSDRHRD